MNGIYRTKTEEASRYEINLKNLTRDHEELGRRWQESQDVNRRLPEYEQKLSQLMQENEKYQMALSGKT